MDIEDRLSDELLSGNVKAGDILVVSAVAGKLVFKSLDGNVEWKYYSDSALTNEITAAEVTKDSYVGLATSSESSEETSNATNGQAQ